jgi:hypothetical protein
MSRIGAVIERVRDDRLLLAALVSFLATALIPIAGRSPTADLSGCYTDHLHHPFAVWVALTKGAGAVYVQPFGEAWQGSSWPFPVHEWPQMPAMVYPPGVLLFFLPITLLGKLVPMSMVTFAKLSLLWVLAGSHVSMYLVWRLLRDLSERVFLLCAFITWLWFLELGLNGFVDALVTGLVALSILKARHERMGAALVIFAAGMSLHFRAGAAFAPVGVWLLWKFWQSTKTRRDWTLFAIFAATGAICVATLLVSIGRVADQMGYWSIIVSTPGKRRLITGISLALAALFLFHRDYVTGFIVLCDLGLMLTERFAFGWHGIILLAAPIAAGTTSTRAAEQVGLLRSAALIWLLLLRPLVWDVPIDFAFREFVRQFA